MLRSESPPLSLILTGLLLTVLAPAARGPRPRYRIAYATYLGGGQFDQLREVIVYPDGSVLVGGQTNSGDLPTTPGAFQRELKGKTDGFLTKLAADGRPFVFSTLLGGSDGEFYLMPTPDRDGNVFLVGTTRSRDFPVTPNAAQTTLGGKTDAFVVKLVPAP